MESASVTAQRREIWTTELRLDSGAIAEVNWTKLPSGQASVIDLWDGLASDTSWESTGA